MQEMAESATITALPRLGCLPGLIRGVLQADLGLSGLIMPTQLGRRPISSCEAPP